MARGKEVNPSGICGKPGTWRNSKQDPEGYLPLCRRVGGMMVENGGGGGGMKEIQRADAEFTAH